MNPKEYKYKINGIKFNVIVEEPEGNTVHVEVNGVPYTVELDKAPETKPSLIKPVKKPEKAPRTQSGQKVVAPPTQEASTSGYKIKAPLPGTIMSIPVNVGDTIAAGATVCVLEAMKMENDIHSPKGGVVKQILVKVGDAVPQDGDIIILD